MSNSRGGFFSLNRFLGKKQKNSKNATNGLSNKSSVQTLTRSTTNLEDISPQNKITPLTAVHNAPFEQTFRTTVYLPHGQLYVARIGAKTKLSELLDMICTNKLLDSSKFQFIHPTDDSQVFSLNFTIGEVGLSEIKLASKNCIEETTVRYRMHSTGQDTRFAIIRPHTMSSVSPYSSTNSLNSTDSLGIAMSQRLSNSHIPAVPGRKKRIAPRPPSQNSIPENPEQKFIGVQTTSEKPFGKANEASLVRQNFHVSSPNLTTNNGTALKLLSTTDTPNSSNLENEQIEKYYRRSISERPISLQMKNDNDKVPVTELNSDSTITYSQNHSRTSSELSDIAADINLPEPQPRKRPIIVKQKAKKAPAPPPRTLSVISNDPIATPRVILQKLNGEGTNCIDAQPKELPMMETPVKSVKSSMNVSKIMLNVNETELPLTGKEVSNQTQDEVSGEQIELKENMSGEAKINNHGHRNIQEETYSSVEQSNESTPKKTSMVNFSITYDEPSNIEIDQNDLSKQVNEIIDEAVKINEAKLNAENELRNEEKNAISDQKQEINNNNESICDRDAYSKRISENITLDIMTEVPIKPILNETRSFDYHDYSDNSLPISTSSATNTIETPSTGPESIITSDIEDGYKGNDVEKKKKVETTYEDSKEDFIESQFGFLSEHLDSKSDDEKTVNSIKTCNIISSTMIADKFSETYTISPPQKKKNVINELTQIINCNRLETFIKPSNDTKNSFDVDKRNSLTNFQIGAYSNANHESSQITRIFNFNDTTNQQQHYEDVTNRSVYESKSDKLIGTQNNATHLPETAVENISNHTESFILPKQIGRSVSFHSTLASIIDRQGNTGGIQNMETSLSESPRSTSYLSLNSFQKNETFNNKDATNNLNAMTRRKASSELTIADSPSLQSIEVMKSILNNSRNSNVPKSEIKSVNETVTLNTQNQKNSSVKNEKRPSVNLSTWSERPKSLVCIKSDDDYIFGGTSKMAALQKRFSETADMRNYISGTKTITSEHCDSNLCNMPIVRSVEYKKNIVLNTNSKDAPDSFLKSNPCRSGHDVSCIIPGKPSIPEKNGALTKTMTLNRFPKTNQISNHLSKKLYSNSNANPSLLYRVQSFDGPQNDTNKTNIINPTHKAIKQFEEQPKAKKPEKTMFSQFTLRKTGLKEKILNESNPNTKNELKVNIVPTAPKPPPMPKKLDTRPVPKVATKIDARDELLNSIRNFNRDALKQNCMY